jgi:hypothetical protein
MRSAPLEVEEVAVLGHVVEDVLALVRDVELRAREEGNVEVMPEPENRGQEVAHARELAPGGVRGVDKRARLQVGGGQRQGRCAENLALQPLRLQTSICPHQRCCSCRPTVPHVKQCLDHLSHDLDRRRRAML